MIWRWQNAKPRGIEYSTKNKYKFIFRKITENARLGVFSCIEIIFFAKFVCESKERIFYERNN